MDTFFIFPLCIFNRNRSSKLFFLSKHIYFKFNLKIKKALFTQLTYGDIFPADLLFKSIRPDTMSIMDCFIMLIVDGILYFLLTIYFDNVIQGEYGRAKPLWFFLSPSYWRKKSNLTNYSMSNSSDIEMELGEDCEPISDEFKDKVALKIKNLVKQFKNEDKVTYNAIDNLNLTVYSGQITAIVN